MEKVKYTDGQIVEIGDVVQIKRFIRAPLSGVVVSVYDPDKPSPPRGDNDYGCSIKLKDGTFLWGVPNEKTILISRKTSR